MPKDQGALRPVQAGRGLGPVTAGFLVSDLVAFAALVGWQPVLFTRHAGFGLRDLAGTLDSRTQPTSKF